ncbi:histone H2B.9-like [Panicum hallii]|uniref:histone H2B.9-like n=1 Tax=Panicum hallii TaxID=206008 RepID=UPI000DF4E137|nr:histone H2B.9-like [Panicum hallii]
MAPKRRSGGKVVGSVVKTKVVQETVEVTTAFVADGEPGQRATEDLALAPPAVDASGGSRSRVVHIEQATSKRGRGGRREEEKPAPPAEEAAQEPPVAQSQETQDPNEEQEEEEDAGKKKKKKKPPQQELQDEEPPETPRVASERKTAAAKRTPQQQQKRGGGGAGGGDKTKTTKAKKGGRRRLGQASPGGDAGMGGVGGYKRYVWRVLKQVHPELGVSGNAMRVLDMMMADMFERLADEAARLSKVSGRATLSSREVQSAVRLVLPGELSRHAMSEGTKAISKYMSYDA